MRPIYLYVHIPKTGGQSVTQHLKKEIGSRLCTLSRRGEQETCALLADRDYSDNLDVVIGHRVTKRTADLFPNRDVRFVTTLRDPVDQMISLRNWHLWQFARGALPEPRPFDEWLAYYKNYQACWLVQQFGGGVQQDEVTAGAARAVLKGFWLVGVLEHVNKTLAPFRKAIGLKEIIRPRKNIGGYDYEKAVTRTPEIEQQIRAMCPVDLALMRDRQPMADLNQKLTGAPRISDVVTC